MQENTYAIQTGAGKWLPLLVALTIGAFVSMNAQAFTVNVVGVDKDGNSAPLAEGFKWLLEEDNTHLPRPGEHPVPDLADVNNNILSLSIHKSHAVVVASGESTGSSADINTTAAGVTPLPAGRYFVSVLPFGDRTDCFTTFDIGGTNIDTNTQSTVTVYVRQQPIETAQISIKVFHDINPINNAPDASEPGLAGFTVTIGDQGGDIITDGFGNPLGTTYIGEDHPDFDLCDPKIDVPGSGDFVTDANGEVFVKNVAPNKYAVQVEPPAGQEGWLQTTTIEGTPTIDAWVRANEPPFLLELGGPRWHVFVGFTKEFNDLLPPGGSTITGQVRKAHLSRPPFLTPSAGPPPEAEAVGERCIVGPERFESGHHGPNAFCRQMRG